MPNNLLHLGVFAALFPNARVIRLTRDPRDTAFSCYRQAFGPGLAWATSLPGIAAWIEGADRLLDHWQQTLPLRFHSVGYEALVRDPAEVLGGALAFLDLPFDRGVLTPEVNPRAVATASALEVRAPVHQRSIGRATRYHPHLRPWF